MKRSRDKFGRYACEENNKIIIDWKIVITAIFCITILEIFAMYFGINGKAFALVLFIIGTLAGLIIPAPKIISRN